MLEGAMVWKRTLREIVRDRTSGTGEECWRNFGAWFAGHGEEKKEDDEGGGEEEDQKDNDGDR